MKKKEIIIISIVFICLIAAGLGIGYYLSNNTNNDSENKIISTDKKQSKSKKEYKITPSENAEIQYEDFNNGLFSMKIPKGWKVKVLETADYIHYTFMVYNPKNEAYKIFFNMKNEGYLKTEEMRNWYKSKYPTAPMAILPAIDPQTTEQFYKKFTEAMNVGGNNTANFTFPTINNFKVIEDLGKNNTGGQIVRATYKNEKNETIDGVFTATIKEVSLYYVIGLNVYNSIFFTAPENELTEWADILNYCISTIQFSDKFVSEYNKQENLIASTIKANAKIYDEITDIITSGWEARQSTYDTISQKQSDATLGYERVYDVDTGEIYKAPNGFMDKNDETKFKAISDDMYNDPIAGYIEY